MWPLTSLKCINRRSDKDFQAVSDYGVKINCDLYNSIGFTDDVLISEDKKDLEASLKKTYALLMDIYNMKINTRKPT